MKKSEMLTIIYMSNNKNLSEHMDSLEDWVLQFNFIEKQFSDVIPLIDREDEI